MFNERIVCILLCIPRRILSRLHCDFRFTDTLFFCFRYTYHYFSTPFNSFTADARTIRWRYQFLFEKQSLEKGAIRAGHRGFWSAIMPGSFEFYESEGSEDIRYRELEAQS